MTSQSAAGNRFPRRSWRPGYNASDVDELTDRIEATLDGSAGPGRAVTGADVRAALFRVTRRRGYDEIMVDDAMDAYAEQLESSTARRW
jgi:DivIVA domain-containing protein